MPNLYRSIPVRARPIEEVGPIVSQYPPDRYWKPIQIGGKTYLVWESMTSIPNDRIPHSPEEARGELLTKYFRQLNRSMSEEKLAELCARYDALSESAAVKRRVNKRIMRKLRG